MPVMTPPGPGPNPWTRRAPQRAILSGFVDALKRAPRTLALLGLQCAAGAAFAAGAQDAAPSGDSADATAAKFEGALAVIAAYGPEIPGADRSAWSAKPAFYLRWGRLSVSNGGVAPRRGDDVVRGIGLDLVDRPRQRITLGLRYDGGRGEEASERLRGLGDVPATLRLRMAGTWELHRDWRVQASWTVDALGRGGGNLGDVRLVHDRTLAPQVTLSASAALTLAGQRYLQTHWGVSAEQAVSSGYAAHAPRSGVRDLTLALGLRSELHRHWAVLGGVVMTRLIGPAADSPIVQRPSALSASAGVVRRF